MIILTTYNIESKRKEKMYKNYLAAYRAATKFIAHPDRAAYIDAVLNDGEDVYNLASFYSYGNTVELYEDSSLIEKYGAL